MAHLNPQIRAASAFCTESSAKITHSTPVFRLQSVHPACPFGLPLSGLRLKPIRSELPKSSAMSFASGLLFERLRRQVGVGHGGHGRLAAS
jgi:hypothetical protein